MGSSAWACRSISSGWFGLNHNYRLYQKGKFEIIKRSLKYDDVIWSFEGLYVNDFECNPRFGEPLEQPDDIEL